MKLFDKFSSKVKETVSENKLATFLSGLGLASSISIAIMNYYADKEYLEKHEGHWATQPYVMPPSMVGLYAIAGILAGAYWGSRSYRMTFYYNIPVAFHF